MKTLFQKYKHAWVLLYFLIYMPWFMWLEKTVVTEYHPVHIKLDDFIPFNEWFVIPYYLWFAFVAAAIIYLFFTDVKEYYRMMALLCIGMTVCLIIYTVWPNGQNLRPDLATLGRENIFTHIVANLYATDTSTNVCPSIHVFNSLGVCIGIFHCSRLRDKKWITIPTLVLTISICLSTVFLKQHSSFDVICGIILAAILYVIVYVPDYEKFFTKRRESVHSAI